MKTYCTLLIFLLTAIGSYAWDFNGGTTFETQNKSYLISDMKWSGTESWKRVTATTGRADKEGLHIEGRNRFLSYIKDPVYTLKGSSVTMSGLYLGKYLDTEHNIPYSDYENMYVSHGYTKLDYIKSIKVYYTPLDNGKARLTAGPGFNSYTTQQANTGNVENYALEVIPYFACTHIPLWCEDVEYGTGNEFAQHFKGYAYGGVIITKIDVEYVENNNRESDLNCNRLMYDQQQYYKDLNSIYKYQNEAYAERAALFNDCDINMDGNINAADVVTIYNRIIEGQKTANGHEYVDLDLPSGTLWATCNVEASIPEGFGDFVAYNSYENTYMKGKSTFSRSTYKVSIFSLVNPGTYPGWEGRWRIPTNKDFDELIQNTTYSYDLVNGVMGCTLTSKSNGASIFLPFAGNVYENGYSNNDPISDGQYFTRYATDTKFNDEAWSLMLFDTNGPRMATGKPWEGHPLRMCYK